MRLIVEIPPALNRFSDGLTRVEVTGRTVEEAMDQVWKRFDRLRSRVLDEQGQIYPYLLVTLNQTALAAADFGRQPVRDGDVIEIVALADGG